MFQNAELDHWKLESKIVMVKRYLADLVKVKACNSKAIVKHGKGRGFLIVA